MSDGWIAVGFLFLMIAGPWLFQLSGDLKDHRRRREVEMTQQPAHRFTVTAAEIEAQWRMLDAQRQMIELARRHHASKQAPVQRPRPSWIRES